MRPSTAGDLSASAGVEPVSADIAAGEPLIEAAGIDPRVVASLASELEVSPVVAQVLARRGHGDPDGARSFIAGEELLADELLPGVPEVASVLASHLAAGTRIAVHGDYDADGVCSTALLVESLARLGAEVTWHVPDRFSDGYGLGVPALERFAADGVGLVIAVDCGVTAVDEARLAAGLGMELAIIDHHERGAELPEVAIAHPGLDAYANPQMCATAVAWKVMRALYRQLGADSTELEQAVELAGLATVTDVMPLTGENRRLVQMGIAAMRVTSRPGLRELMRVAGVDPLQIDATTFGFRLGPRINAAGRMRSAEAAVELMLTTSEQRAAQLADELNGLNAGRREIEQEVLWQAGEQAEQQLGEFGLVVAGEGWHKGVLGIVAGRLAERHRRPCLALSIDGHAAEGSGRSGGRFDLTGALRQCADTLNTFGGHQAAAGLGVDVARLDEFRAQFQSVARQALSADDLRPHFTVDAVAGTGSLTLDVAEQLARIGPFGQANAEPLLLVPDITIELHERMGAARQHARLTLASEVGRTRAVAFNWQSVKPPGNGPWRGHAVVGLQRNEWRGNVEAQVQVHEIVVAPSAAQKGEWEAVDWASAFAAEIASTLPLSAIQPDSIARLIGRSIDRRGETAAAPLIELLAAGRSVTLATRDIRRWHSFRASLEQIGFDAGAFEVVALGIGIARSLVGDTLVLADPPIDAADLAFIERFEGDVICAWQLGEDAASRRTIDARHCDRAYVAAFWRLFEGQDEHTLASLRDAAADSGIDWLDAVAAARIARVLSEIELAELIPDGSTAETIRVVRQRRTELDRSEAFRSYSENREQAIECLNQLTSKF